MLYIPRAFYHWTSTSEEALAAPDTALDPAFGVDEAAAAAAAAAGGEGDGGPPTEGEPSLALTLSVLTEDVFCSWALPLVGRAVRPA